MVSKPSGGKLEAPGFEGSGDEWARGVEALGHALCVTDLKGAIRRCNTAFAELAGRPADTLRGEDCCSVVHGGGEHPPGCPFVAMLDSHSRQDAEFRRGERRLRVAVDPIFDPDGTLSGAAYILADVTDRRRTEEDLRASTAKLRAVFEAIPDLILVLDRDGRYREIAPTNPSLLYRPAQELLGKTLHEVFPTELADTFLGYVSRVLDTRQTLNIEYSLPIRHQERFFGAAISPMLEDRVVWVARDLTERKRAEDLQAAMYELSEAAHQAESPGQLFASIHAIVGRLMEAKNLYIALYDPAADLITFPYFVDEEDEAPEPRRPRRGLTEYILRTGRPLLATPEVFEDLSRRGEVVLLGAPSIDWLGVPLMVGDRTIGALVVQTYTAGVRYGEREKDILTFVSRQAALAIERKAAEGALRESEERYRMLFQRAPIGVFHYDNQLRITDCNDRFVEILASSRERLIGFDMNNLRDGRVLPAIREAVKGGYGRYDGSHRSTTGSSEPFVSLWTAPLRRDDGTITGGVGIVQDMSEHKRLEGQLLQSQKMEVVGTLAGGVAHDFNNLLQAMLSRVQVLSGQPATRESVLEVVHELEEQINRGASLTRQLLVFSRRETVRPERIDLNDAVREATQILRRLVRANIALVIDLAPGRLVVEADRGQIQQVLMNLTLNASDAMPEGGTLLIRTGGVDGERVWLSVEDSGHGIPEGMHEHIFEPFFTTKAPGKGTGLGLAVVHGIVTRHGGRIEVDSREGAGSTFTVILPATAGELAPVAEPPPPVTDLELGRGERVLLVEDEDGAREGLHDILTSLRYEVVAVDSGEAAALLPLDRPFDVLLTDLMLPGVAGPQVAERLKEQWPDLRVILMSGYAEDEAVRRGVNLGRLRFLQKPFDINALAHEVRAALAERPGPATE